MQKIAVISMGKLKDLFFKDAENEYLKRISGFANLTVIELPQKSISQHPSESEINSALKDEAELIISKIPKGAYVVSLCIEGKGVTSEELAGLISENANYGSGNMVFIIGSSYGLSDDVKKISNYKLSMSKMTFPHRMARIMLLEQIYRSYKIISGEEYHK